MAIKYNKPTIVSPSNGATISSSSITFSVQHPQAYNNVTYNTVDAYSFITYWVKKGTTYIVNETRVSSSYRAPGYQENITISNLQQGYTYTLGARAEWNDQSQYQNSDNVEVTVTYPAPVDTRPTVTIYNASTLQSTSYYGSVGVQCVLNDSYNTSNNRGYSYRLDNVSPHNNSATTGYWPSNTNLKTITISPDSNYFPSSGNHVYFRILAWSTQGDSEEAKVDFYLYHDYTLSISHYSTSNLTSTFTVTRSYMNNSVTVYYKKSTSSSYTSASKTLDSNNRFSITFPSNGTYSVYITGTHSESGALRTSNTISTTINNTENCTAPGSVTLSIQTTNTKTAKITWSGGSGGTNNAFSTYHWVWSTSSTNPPTEVYGQYGDSTSSPKTGIALPSITSNTSFYAFVQTRGAAGASYYSSFTRSSALTVTLCTAPTSVSAIAGLSNGSISWSGASNGTNNAILSYDIGYSTSPSASSPTSNTIINTTNTSYTYTLNSGTTYYFFVRSNGVFNTSEWKKASAGITPYSYGYCTAPSYVSQSISGSTITVTWGAGAGGNYNSLTGYAVIKNTSTSTSGATTVNSSVSTSPRSQTYTVSNLGTYYAGVKSRGSISGYDSGYTWSSGLTVGAVTNPTNADATEGLNSITISFSGAYNGTNNNIAGYTIGYSTSSSATSPTSGTVDVTSSPYTYSGLTSGTPYYFFIQTYGTIGNSGSWKKINTTAVTPQNYSACTSPSTVNAYFNDGYITIEWSGATGGNNNPITGYRVAYNYTDSGGYNDTYIFADSPISTTNTFGSYSTSSFIRAGNTYTFGVQTLGTVSGYHAPDYTWSTSVYIPEHPTVSTGDLITKTNMDNLRSYKANNPNAVSQNTTINASDGNTYKNNLIAGTTQITADWYNNA